MLVMFKLRFNSVATHPVSTAMDKEFALASLTFENEKPLIASNGCRSGNKLLFSCLIGQYIYIYIFPYIYYPIKDKRLRVFYLIAICIWKWEDSFRQDMILFITATEYYYYWKAVYSVQVLTENLKVHLKTHTKKNVWHIKGVGQFTRNERRDNAST